MDNSEWRKKQKEHWPDGALERSLIRDYPGCKSVLEALSRALSSKQPVQPNVTPTEVSVKESELDRYLALRESIRTVEHFIHNGFDTWSVDEETRKRLNEMPINSIAEALLWRDCWKAEIKKIMERRGG
jgi:hypothetical protein